MGPTQALVARTSTMPGPRAAGIPASARPVLVRLLQARLGADAESLDLSVASVGRLEKALQEYHRVQGARVLATMDEGSTLQVVREVAAYIGEVLVHNFGAQWEDQGSLWFTFAVLKNPSAPAGSAKAHRALSVADLAAGAWDALLLGKPLRLGEVLRLAKRNRISEEL